MEEVRMSEFKRVDALLTEEELRYLLVELDNWCEDRLWEKLAPLEQLKAGNPGATFRLTVEVKP